ncbi:XrtA/PEP-CTERM system exopolysaccharide export protein [Oxalobacteraceae bacterium A2-2]
MKRICTAALAAILAGGCAQRLPPAGEVAAPPQADYRIAAGDVISINVWRNADVSLSVPVRPDGRISAPLVEDLQAAGKTPTALARDLELALAKYIQQPLVTVIVTSFVGQYEQQIRVIGQAARPQALSYRQGMSLMDVLIAVGGVTDFAAGNKATIVRTVDGERRALRVRLQDLLRDGDISANVAVLPGDVLVIPESWF